MLLYLHTITACINCRYATNDSNWILNIQSHIYYVALKQRVYFNTVNW